MEEKNVFEDFQAKKQEILKITEKAAAFGWITKERAAEIVKKIESDVLTIGVIGQMKCGKSTFLNAFVFEDDILPSATTPMTAALTVVTYGAEKKLTAEFYTADEWAEQKAVASQNAEDFKGNEKEYSKIKAAQELGEKSKSLGDSLSQYLGKTQSDSIENLVDYVGADGKFVAITKSVKIYFPKDYLKGVEIVDTPGMNDPIVSREERTKEFLSKADVVLVMLYAGRPFDSTDHAILFDNVRKCGIGKVLIGINKYDIPYMNGEDESVIQTYVEDEIRKACRECQDDSLVEILKETKPVLLSAGMALLSELPMSKIEAKNSYKSDWARFCDNFEISSQPQFREKSHIDTLSQQVIDMIENEKGEILFKKPKNEIRAAGTNKKVELEKALSDASNSLKVLSMPDSELDEKLEAVEKAKKRMGRKLERFEESVQEECLDKAKALKHKMEDTVSEACKKMGATIDSTGGLFGRDKLSGVKNEIDRQQIKLRRNLERMRDEESNELRKSLKKFVEKYFDDIAEMAEKYLDDFDYSDFISAIRSKVTVHINDDVDLSGEKIFNGDFWNSDLGFWSNSKKETIKAAINDFDASFSASSVLDSLNACIETVTKRIKKEVEDEFLGGLEKTVNECKANKANKEAEIQKQKATLEVLQTQKAEFDKQLKEIETM